MPDQEQGLSVQAIDQLIWDVVAAIPKGKVASYGEVAKRAGLGRAARRVSPALKRAPTALKLPWYRVITSSGKLAFPEHHPGYQKQRQRLTAEGVLFINQRVDMRNFAWIASSHHSSGEDSLDAIIWGNS